MHDILFAESKANHNVAVARSRVVTLRCAVHSGANVVDQLRDAEAELESLKRNLARGDILSLCVLGFFVGFSILSVYFFASNDMLVQLWGTPEHPYLKQFRPDAAYLWRTCQGLSSSYWLIIGSIVLFAALWRMQRRIERRLARRILCGLAAVFIMFDGMLLFTFMHLLMLPLG